MKPKEMLRQNLTREISLSEAEGNDSSPALSDDRPFNEYFWLRRSWSNGSGGKKIEYVY
jgi:hypothetical protein